MCSVGGGELVNAVAASSWSWLLHQMDESRNRSRQGDPGSSRFYLSLEDDLMRIFASEKVSSIMQKLGMDEGVPIESRLISRRIEAAQKQVEGHNFTIRKHLLEYDDVMNQQRKTIYGLRNKFLGEGEQKEYLLQLTEDLIADAIDQHCSAEVNPQEWDVDGLRHDGVLTGAPFTNRIDFVNFDFWHYDGRTSKHGAFMGGADFVQWHGNYPLLKHGIEIKAMADELRREHGAKK